MTPYLLICWAVGCFAFIGGMLFRGASSYHAGYDAGWRDRDRALHPAAPSRTVRIIRDTAR